MQLMASAFRTLLRDPDCNLSLLSRRLTQLLHRTEERRLQAWKKIGLRAPPRPLTRRSFPRCRLTLVNLKQ